jgi:hypothetical protein
MLFSRSPVVENQDNFFSACLKWQLNPKHENEAEKSTHQEVSEHPLQFNQCLLVFAGRIRFGLENGIPCLGHHVEVLHARGHVARRPQIGQTHEPAVGPTVLVRPIIPGIASFLVTSRLCKKYKQIKIQPLDL